MKYLVLGVSGMAGHIIAQYLKEQGNEVVGFSRRPVDFIDCVKGDAFDTELLKNIINGGCFDYVINAIGVLAKDAELNKDRAVYLNAYLPHYLASITKESDTAIIQMSTDCVFAGNTGPYSETSFPDGALFYDRSKALGELNDEKNLTLRNSIIGPDVNEDGVGLFNWFMSQDSIIRGYTGAMWSGLSTLELAKAIECSAEEHAVGLVNMVPESSISKYELLCLFNKFCKGSVLHIEPDSDFKLDKTLVRTNYKCSYMPQPYEVQVEEMRAWIQSHNNLYPHYQIG